MNVAAAALANPNNRAILERLPRLGLPQACLVAGCLYQSYWNLRSGRPAAENIRDYDIFYFDPGDLSFEAEDRVIRAFATATADLGIRLDVKNQARVHLWYRQRFGIDRAPLGSCAEAIGSFTAIATCVGLAPGAGGSADLIVPYGVADLEAGLLRLNSHCPNPENFRPKAESLQARWPWLRIIEP